MTLPMRAALRWMTVLGTVCTVLTAAPAHGAPATPSMTVYSPGGHRRMPAVLFVHGGAWRRAIARPAELRFARDLERSTGWVVAVPTYRIAQPRRELQPADVHAALVALAHRPDVDPQRLVVWGESAGAQLALLEAYRHPNFGSGRIRAVISVSGPTDLMSEYAAGGQLFVQAVQDFEQAAPTVAATHHDPRYQETSPVFQVRRTSPPTFQALAYADPLVPPSQVEELDRALTSHRVAHRSLLVPGKMHANLLESQRATPTGPTVADLAIAFAQAHLTGETSEPAI